jgi:L-2,4-diaminobutyric acid acetyltransferase
LLQCSHFSDTSIIAKKGKNTVGFISGYVLPKKPFTLFIWQVAVSTKARGQGLAKRMLHALLLREQHEEVRYIETTITKDNKASWALFKGLATELGANIETTIAYDKEAHFNGAHDSEYGLRIGPLK